MKKVLFAATVDSHIKNFHLPYLKYFKEHSYEVHVATNSDEPILYCDVKHKVTFERSPFKLNNLKAISELKDILNKEEFDIIHCHTPMGGVVTRLASKEARKYGTKVIYTAHGFHFFKGAPLINWMVYYPVEKYLSKFTDMLITINSEDYNVAKNKFHSKDVRLVNGVGVDKNKFSASMSDDGKEKYRKSLGLSTDDFVVVSVGELNKNKNQIMQINAMKEVLKKSSNAKLLIAGDGILKDFYIRKIKEYGLEANIILLGFRNDIYKLLQVSDLLVSTSRREGLPVNILEAMFIGLPVIATDCRGNRDLVDSKNLVKIGDTQLLAEKILLSSNKKVKYDVEKYELSNVTHTMGEIYDEYYF